jgi:hypothetical protein
MRTMNNTTTADRFAIYRATAAAQAKAKAVRYASYAVFHNDRQIANVSFPSDTRNANFCGVCFYDPATDTFLGDTQVDEYFVKRVG